MQYSDRIASVVSDVNVYNVVFKSDDRVIGRVQVIAPDKATAFDLACRWRDQDRSRLGWQLNATDGIKRSGSWVAGYPHIGAYPMYKVVES